MLILEKAHRTKCWKCFLKIELVRLPCAIHTPRRNSYIFKFVRKFIEF
jgi:hypothetical protein